MATRHGVKIPVTDRENVNKGKNLQIVKAVEKRPAFSELGNKLHAKSTQQAATKKQPTNIEQEPAKPASQSITDPDKNDRNEPQLVTEYLPEIFSHLREMETKYPIRKKFLENHKSTPRMRAVLVNWLVEVHSNFKLMVETLHICVSLIDRYLQDNQQVGRNTLQLVGSSALLVACKYEEMYVPDLSDFVYICDDTFTKRQILRMEIDILRKLDFGLGRPTSMHFLRRYSKVGQVKGAHHALGKYLLELGLLDHRMSHIKPSIQAAAACCLAVGILDDETDLEKVWTPTLVHYSTYKYTDIESVIHDFAQLLSGVKNSKYQAVTEKYASRSYAEISRHPKLKGKLVHKLIMNKPISLR